MSCEQAKVTWNHSRQCLLFVCEEHHTQELVRDFEQDPLASATLLDLAKHLIWHQEQMKLEDLQEQVRAQG
jgi:hypothetical protein